MNALWFILIGISIFLCVLIGGKKYRSTALYALAIGGIVNANFFNATTTPIDIFGLPFGIDSIIYTLFVFCVIVMQLTSGKREAYILTVSSVVAIIISAVIQLLATLLSTGSSTEVWTTFLGFIISAFASLVAMVVMVELIAKLKNKNCYLVTIIALVAAIIINSGIYYPLSMLACGMPANIGTLLLTSIIGKFFAMGISLLILFIIRKIDGKSSSNSDKEEKDVR